MTEKFKILGEYIKDLSSETPDIETYIFVKDRIANYHLDIDISSKALKVHGYDDNFLSKQKKFSEIASEFLEFIKDKRLIIHNAEFDLAHLNNELYIFGENKITNEIVDTLILAREKFPGSQVSLDALCKRFRVDNSKRAQHSALIDCDLLAKVYINLTEQKEPTLNFENIDKENLKLNNSRVDYFKKVIVPSKEEFERHKQYLKENLKKNFF